MVIGDGCVLCWVGVVDGRRMRLRWMLVGKKQGVAGFRTRGFVWASKREAEKGHTETRSKFGDFCLARVRGVVREGLVYNRACAGGLCVILVFCGSGGHRVGQVPTLGWYLSQPRP